jgi:hypothetical protein
MKVRNAVCAVAAIAAFGVATGGGCAGQNDATVTHRDNSGAEKLNMPDKFDTIANKCDGHGGRVYESQNHGDTKASGLSSRIDPTCPGGAKPTR